ncbi:MAG: flagellar export chaperone FlgN [Phycisphaeraceae bacterium]|nr:flagellar export chaperone FlgN [Phycisphaeraceae bacterium]
MDKTALTKKLDELEKILEQQIALHKMLLMALGRKHQAIRQSKTAEMEACCLQENQHLQAIGEAEKQRQTLVAELTLAMDPRASAPMTLLQLAERQAEPWRTRLLMRRLELRELAEKTRTQSSIARKAAESLLRHVQGLMQTISQAVGGGAVYGASGALPQRSMKLSTFSTTA